MKKRLKTYIVTVKTTVLDYYEIEARSTYDATDRWMEGRFLHTDEAYLNTEPVDVIEKGVRP